MATAAITYTFAAATTILSAEANTNFSDLVTFLNGSVMHLDASSAFTAVPSGPSTDPSTANHLSRKSYVDAADLLRAKDGTAAGAQTGVSGTITHGTHQLLIQSGTHTGIPSASGGVTISFPTAFPTGVLTILVANGDTDAASSVIVGVDHSTVGLSSFVARMYDDTGAVVTNNTRRWNWIATGW